MRLLPSFLLLFTAACTAPVVTHPAPKHLPPSGPLLIKVTNMDEKGQQRVMPEIFELLPNAEKPRFAPFPEYKNLHDDEFVKRGLCDNMVQFTDAKGLVQRRCGGHQPGHNERPPAPPPLPETTPSNPADTGKTAAK